MKRKFSLAFGLAAGQFTPFLSPYWGRNEYSAINAWMKGESFPSAPQELCTTLQASLGNDWTVAMTNLGRSALQAALECMSLDAGAKVLLSPVNCTGVIMPIIQAGLTPVFVDVDEHFNVCYESVVRADTSRVGAIILGHLSGCWARDTDRIISWAHARGILVIEDVAQAQGLEMLGRPAGTFGDVGIFSCHGGKAIFSSGGGWVVTRHPTISYALKKCQLQTESRQNVEARVGGFLSRYAVTNPTAGRRHLREMITAKLRGKYPQPSDNIADYRFTLFEISDIEAQLILLQLPKVSEIVARRIKHARRLIELFNLVDLPGVRCLPMDHNIHVKMLLPAPVGEGHALRILWEELLKAGVETESSYLPLHLRKPFAGYRADSLEMAERNYQGAFCIPVRPDLVDADWRRMDKAVSQTSAKLKRLPQ